ncbi:MAG: TolC family protein, partial [Betaproteobacteria bacterium]
MKTHHLCRVALFAAFTWVCSGALCAQESLPGGDVASLLSYAREHNPDFAAMRYEAQAAQERIEVAGALPDPRLRTTLSDITRAGEQNPSLLPGRVGKTSYQWMQDVPWFGKRDLKREIAQQEALGAQGRTRSNWAELSSRIKSTHAQRYFLQRSEQLVAENLALMAQLEQVALARYAGGLSAQQDAIRAQLEQGAMSSEQIALDM